MTTHWWGRGWRAALHIALCVLVAGADKQAWPWWVLRLVMHSTSVAVPSLLTSFGR